MSVLGLVEKERFGRHEARSWSRQCSFLIFSAVSNVGNTYFSTHLAHELHEAAEFVALSQHASPIHCHQSCNVVVPMLWNCTGDVWLHSPGMLEDVVASPVLVL